MFVVRLSTFTKMVLFETPGIQKALSHLWPYLLTVAIVETSRLSIRRMMLGWEHHRFAMPHPYHRVNQFDFQTDCVLCMAYMVSVTPSSKVIKRYVFEADAVE